MFGERFDISQNAFVILNARYNSDHSEIADLAEDAEFEERHSPETIQWSRQALLSPVTRLTQELGWLPELSAAQIDTVRPMLDAPKAETLLDAAGFLPELPKANLLAHLCGLAAVDAEHLRSLLHCWEEHNEHGLLQFLNAQRRAAGFPEVTDSQLRASLGDLESAHARNAAMGVWRLDEPGRVMERLVEAELERSPSSSVLAKFVREYDAISEPKLSQIGAEIEEQAERIRHPAADLENVVARISVLLERWDDVNQPVQIYEQHHGHEEGRSKKIYEVLRALCLELANERGEYQHAKRLSEALLHTFPELESVAEVLRVDIETLGALDKEKKRHAILEPLALACEAAKSEPQALTSALRSHGSMWEPHSFMNDIREAFESAAALPNNRDAAFLIVRDLALFVNNEWEDPETAFRLVDGLLTHPKHEPSTEVEAKLDEERAVLHRNWKMAVLEKQAGNPHALLATLEEMLRYANGDDRTKLIQIRTGIERQKANKKKKALVWCAIIAVIALIAFPDLFVGSSSRTPYSSASSGAPVDQTKVSSARDFETTVEERPPVGQGLTFGRGQVRYCVFQGERLEAIRSLAITNHQIDRFNLLINDYNSRCSDYRYRSGSLSAARHEAREQSERLARDARGIVASW